jgi:hypothetical protein
MNADGSIKILRIIQFYRRFNPDFVGFSWNALRQKIIYPNFDKLYEINSSGMDLGKIFQTSVSLYLNVTEQ